MAKKKINDDTLLQLDSGWKQPDRGSTIRVHPWIAFPKGMLKEIRLKVLKPKSLQPIFCLSLKWAEGV